MMASAMAKHTKPSNSVTAEIKIDAATARTAEWLRSVLKADGGRSPDLGQVLSFALRTTAQCLVTGRKPVWKDDPRYRDALERALQGNLALDRKHGPSERRKRLIAEIRRRQKSLGSVH